MWLGTALAQTWFGFRDFARNSNCEEIPESCKDDNGWSKPSKERTKVSIQGAGSNIGVLTEAQLKEQEGSTKEENKEAEMENA